MGLSVFILLLMIGGMMEKQLCIFSTFALAGSVLFEIILVLLNWVDKIRG